MTAANGAIANSGAAARDAAAWTAIRADDTIQFAPVPPPKPPVTPEWLLEIGRFFEKLLGPLGEFIGINWPVFRWVLLGLAALGALALLWALVIRPLLDRRRAVPPAEPEWAPQRDAALALLEDADRLAAQGDYAEAAHMLLRRSFGDIAAARPDWLVPASTAREIGALTVLPERARSAFATIAQVVERSLFGLRGLAEPDWLRARSAYADFALAGLAPSGLAK